MQCSFVKIGVAVFVCSVLTACNLRPTTPASGLLPTRTLAPRPVGTYTPESLETKTPPTEEPVATATRRARATPVPDSMTIAADVITPLNADRLEDQWSVSDAYMTYIFAASNERLGVSTSQGYKLVDAKTLDVIQSTRLDVATRSKSVYFWAISMNARYSGHYYEDGGLSIYDLTTGAVVTTLQFSPVISTALADIGFSPDGGEVTVANASIQRYDTSTGNPIGKKLPLPSATRGVMVLRDGVYVAAFTDSDIMLMNAQTGKTVKLVTPFGAGQARYVRSAPDNSLMFSADSQGQVVAWDPTTGQKKYEKNFGQKVDIAPGPNGKYVAVVYQDGVTIETVGDQKELAQMRLKGGASPISAQFDTDGRTLFVSSISSLESFSVPDGARINYVSILPIRNAAFTFDSRYLVSWVAGDSPGLAILDAATGNIVAAYSHPAIVSQVVVGSTSDTIAVGTTYGAIYVWTVTGEEPVASVPASFTVGRGLLGFANDDRDVVYVEGRNLVVLSVASPQTKTVALPLQAGAIGYSGRTGLVAVGDDATAQVVNIAGKTVATLEKASGLLKGVSFVFSSDEKSLVGKSSDEVMVWDVSTGKLLQHLKDKESLIAPASFTPDGASVMLRYGNSADLLSVHTGAVTTVSGPAGHTFNLGYSPDMQLTATGTYIDNTIGSTPNYRLGEFDLWIAGAQQRLVKFANLLPIYFVLFSPDGTHVATASPSGELVMWGLPAK